jgi:uncharacterized cupredoxin-like copper-binding protein
MCHEKRKPLMKTLHSCTALALLLALSAPALSHGDAHQSAAGRKFDYGRAEPTPFGIAADPRKARRTIHIDMSDSMRFTPAELRIRQGETVRFVVRNRGQLMHEMVLGTMAELKQHAEQMKKHPNMEHDEPHMAHVSAGKSGEIGWRFTEAGTFYFGCLVPGHFDAGMIGRIAVTARQEAK